MHTYVAHGKRREKSLGWKLHEVTLHSDWHILPTLLGEGWAN